MVYIAFSAEGQLLFKDSALGFPPVSRRSLFVCPTLRDQFQISLNGLVPKEGSFFSSHLDITAPNDHRGCNNDSGSNKPVEMLPMHPHRRAV
jgi:hypothetical protein